MLVFGKTFFFENLDVYFKVMDDFKYQILASLEIKENLLEINYILLNEIIFGLHMNQIYLRICPLFHTDYLLYIPRYYLTFWWSLYIMTASGSWMPADQPGMLILIL